MSASNITNDIKSDLQEAIRLDEFLIVNFNQLRNMQFALISLEISLNNTPGAIIRWKAIIQGSSRWLFQIFLTGSRALNILFYYPNKSKNYHIK